MTNDLERRPTRLPTRERIMRRVLGAVVTLGTGTLILTLAIDQPISIDISGRVEGRAKVIIGTPGAVEREIRELPPVAVARYVAFPGAEGYGAQATWGLKWGTTEVHRSSFLPIIAAVVVPNDSVCNRSNAYIHFVTNTNGSGSGSLFDIIENQLHADTMDYVIFSTGGTITTSAVLDLNNHCVYVAGQTAPGGGFQVYKSGTTGKVMNLKGAEDAIVRYLRIRAGATSNERDVVGVNAGRELMFDHLSVSFGRDEVFSLTPPLSASEDVAKVTIQWTIIGPGLRPKALGSLFGNPDDESAVVDSISAHHNMWIHVTHRGPYIKYVVPLQVINNVNYNWTGRVGYCKWESEVDFIRNWWSEGPANAAFGRIFALEVIGEDAPPTLPDEYCHLYLAANRADPFQTDTTASQKNFCKINRDWVACPDSVFEASPLSDPTIAVTEYSAVQAKDSVLAYVGAYQKLNDSACDGTWLANRDALDSSLVADVVDGTGPTNDSEWDNPSDFGGIPTLAAGTPCTDTDSDGLPDAYETAQCGTTTCMDPRADPDADGFINLEEYLNGTTPY